MNKKMQWIKLGLIFAVIVLAFEVIDSYFISQIIHSSSLLGVLMLYLEKIIYFPLYLLSYLSANYSNYIIFYFVNYNSGSYVSPNISGYVLIALVWFVIGALISKLYYDYKK